MADDRTVLIRYVAHLEMSPRPGGWMARLRRAWDIHQARGMLDWEEARQEGPAFFTEMRNTFGVGWLLMWVGTAVSALFFSHHPLTLARVGLFLGLSALPVGAGSWYLSVLPKRFFRYSERRYATYLERARALPAPAGDPDPQAAA
jgi:hypothetical protein